MGRYDRWSLSCFHNKSSSKPNFYTQIKNLCKSIVGIDASQFYSYSMCQDMHTGFYTRWYYNEETEARQNWDLTFENMVMSYFEQPHLNAKTKVTKLQELHCFSVDGYCNQCKTVFEAMGCYFHFCPYQDLEQAWLMMISNEEPRKKKRMSFEKIKFERKVTL